MGLLNKLGISHGTARPTAPEPVKALDDARAVCAPLSGRLVALDDVSDPAFSQGMLGLGVAIKGDGEVAYSPVTGTVVAEVKSKHALLIHADNGAEVLLHVGLDSVSLRGCGFRQFVEKGDEVRAGDPLMSFDRSLMAERGLDDTVLVTVTNPEVFDNVEVARDRGEVTAGAPVLWCAS